MEKFDVELVGKIGSMALIRKEDNDLDYNIFSSLGRELMPGMIWISSGAVEIGRLDYMNRNNGAELSGDIENVKADYAAQGQAILMENYRRFIDPAYSVRQVLVEHQHFNDLEKRQHIHDLLIRATKQNAIPIINYNDPVNVEENRKLELADIKSSNKGKIVELIDNDETAAIISTTVKAKTMLLLTSVKGILQDINDADSLVKEISGKNIEEVIENIKYTQNYCVGASREGANGAKAKLQYAIEPVKFGTKVIIASAQYKISEILAGKVPCTVIGVR